VFGAAGDFITAPEICQIFGELVGIWFAVRWHAAGRPGRFSLVECGPGRGTLIADALRAAASVPGFAEAIDLHLLETSPSLRQAQGSALAGFPATWHDRLDTLPVGPLHLIGNEFLDALPATQWVFRAGGWRQRQVGAIGDTFIFVEDPTSPPPPADLLAALPLPRDGDVVEHGPAAETFVSEVAHRIATSGGAALFFDYGPQDSGFGDTLQAVGNHRYVAPLDSPGQVDLTMHVDFSRLGRVVSRRAAAFGPADQATWLVGMGLPARLTALLRHATPQQRDDLVSATRRLIEPQGMGRLFKSFAILPNGSPLPEGF
jgi:NADH dehydrogenase [ubiquinone] 1 alpha subcomplex assembly factor 7